LSQDSGILLAEHRFPARPGELRRLRRVVARAVAGCGCADACVRDVVLAVDEACQNIIRHAYAGRRGDIVLSLRLDGEHLVISLVDFAAPVDVSKICPRSLDELRPGGLGTHFMRSVMDHIAYLPPPPGAGNLLRMTKRIGP
jgi:sigma-B regulation protein RsbU (phosphoserine phosphatase)